MPVEGNGRAVLIVEDSETCAATLEVAFLKIPGVSVLFASSGVDAVRLLESGGGIEAIVTDLNMPRMDGFELIRRIRADRRFSSTPIIAVSADADPATPGRVAALGANAFFSKPYSPTAVRKKLEQFLDGTTE